MLKEKIMKKFKTESKRVLDMVINSIYTHKEIFLRELLSNASDAIDKLYYKGLTGGLSGLDRGDFSIDVTIDKEARTLTVSDNGIGMTCAELEENLGTIAKSGSLAFKEEHKDATDVDVIGQFGVGFYSAFMVASKVEVLSKAYGTEQANLWTSNGTDGYDVQETEKADRGTIVKLYIKANTEEENFDSYLDEYFIKSLIKKYSDYIRYPIKMPVKKTTPAEKEGEDPTVTETIETVNSMVPLWKKQKSEIQKEEYDKFYQDMFYDYDAPLRVLHASAEGAVDYKTLLFVPAHAPYNYYTKNYEKGLRLYTNGVLIMERCEDLLPDYFSFVKGLVDSELTLNVSRETVQHDRQLKLIRNNLEKKIKNDLLDMLKEDREHYEKFYEAFGLQLKYGLYSDWGTHKDVLQDLILFRSAKEDKMLSLAEYVAAMKEDQKYIYYATGNTADAIRALPQSEKVLEAGYDILCFTDDVDEFAIKILEKYEEKEFRSVSGDTDLEEPAAEESDRELMTFLKEALADEVKEVRASARLKTHPVCLTSEGQVSIEMEKVLNKMPNGTGGVKAEKVLEINRNHPIYEKLKTLYAEDSEKLKSYAKVLLVQAKLIEGLPVEKPTEAADLICNLLS